MDINSMYLEELEELFLKKGEKKFRAAQAYNFFHKNGKFDIINSNLSKNSKAILKDYDLSKVSIYRVFESKLDDTKKLLFSLDDGELIEGVLMKYKHGYSQCISTQVGCRMGCVFCASTKEGLIRNLRASEMLGQIYAVENYFGIRVSNFILMGSGEPLDNYENVIRFIKILNSKSGHDTSMRNITISTCGVANGIDRLAEEKLPINLAISLHQVSNKKRSQLMPINKSYDLSRLKESLINYERNTNRRITFEYTLIEGENDGDSDVLKLRDYLRGLNAHINLIPLNPIDEYEKSRPDNKAIRQFQKKLQNAGINATIRRELGSDIDASCGQLRLKHKEVVENEVCSKDRNRKGQRK